MTVRNDLNLCKILSRFVKKKKKILHKKKFVIYKNPKRRLRRESQ